MAAKDRVFEKKAKLVKDFDFGKDTAAIFDDMLDRSVPFYSEIQRMIAEMCGDFATSGSNLYDLGCSTGNTFARIHQQIPKDVTLIGVDDSEDMLARARKKVLDAGVEQRVEWVCQDLNQGVQISNASVVIMNLTLQFIRPLFRQELVRSIASGINEGGCVILVEKVLSPYTLLNRLFIKYYYDMKRKNGYSEMEIAQKREALENVLIPYHMTENVSLMMSNGFTGCDVFFRWYNFCGMVAVK